jgi:hypothetical protein
MTIAHPSLTMAEGYPTPGASRTAADGRASRFYVALMASAD